ncbi:hypothetical protein BDZ91DRAFT_715833 [Kalaharituber pfeilii]|nr:hypothetical protein BDZ91DRAFT_715833 [Kalaharituber pfeilii]
MVYSSTCAPTHSRCCKRSRGIAKVSKYDQKEIKSVHFQDAVEYFPLKVHLLGNVMDIVLICLENLVVLVILSSV